MSYLLSISKRDADGWSNSDSESNDSTVDDVVADVKANANLVYGESGDCGYAANS